MSIYVTSEAHSLKTLLSLHETPSCIDAAQILTSLAMKQVTLKRGYIMHAKTIFIEN